MERDEGALRFRQAACEEEDADVDARHAVARVEGVPQLAAHVLFEQSRRRRRRVERLRLRASQREVGRDELVARREEEQGVGGGA